MKQWMIPLVTFLVGAGVAAGAILGLTRPWQSEEPIPAPTSTPASKAAPTSTPKAAFTEFEIILLTQQQLSSGTVLPAGAKSVGCGGATYKPDADMWVVSCSFYSDQEGTQVLTTGFYTVSDKDGKLVK